MGFLSGNRKNQPSIPTEKSIQRIGVAGTTHHTGTTHLAINIAITLRSLNYKVAVLEDNPSKHFELIASELDYDINENVGYFNYKGVDYYHYCRPIPFFVLMQRNYDFLVIDHGIYASCDRSTFYANNINIITTGSRLWELADFENFMEGVQVEERGIEIENRMSRQYNYAFMFAHDDYFFQKQILEHMGDDIKSIFPAYKENLFDDPDYDTIKQLIPWVQIPEQSGSKNKTHSLFGLKFNKESKYKEEVKETEYKEELIRQDTAFSQEIPEKEDDYVIEQPEDEPKEDFFEDITSERESIYPSADSLHDDNMREPSEIEDVVVKTIEPEKSPVAEAIPVPIITQENGVETSKTGTKEDAVTKTDFVLEINNDQILEKEKHVNSEISEDITAKNEVKSIPEDTLQTANEVLSGNNELQYDATESLSVETTEEFEKTEDLKEIEKSEHTEEPEKTEENPQIQLIYDKYQLEDSTIEHHETKYTKFLDTMWFNIFRITCNVRDGFMPDNFTIIVFPTEIAKDRRPLPQAVALLHNNSKKIIFSNEKKGTSVEINYEDYMFAITSRFVDGKLNTKISLANREYEITDMEEDNFSGNIIPEHFGKTLYFGDDKVEIYPLNISNSEQSGCVSFMYKFVESDKIIYGASEEDDSAVIATKEGGAKRISCYWAGQDSERKLNFVVD